MKIKKLLSSALVVVMLFTSVIAFIPPLQTSAAHSPSVSTETKTYDEIVEIVNEAYESSYATAEEALAADLARGYLDSVSSASNEYTLYINRYTGVAYYKNNLTGEILTSNPYDISGISAADVKQDLMSQIYVEYQDALTQSSTVIVSSRWAAEYAQLTVTPIADGLRVNYTLGDLTTRFLLPMQITAERFDEAILKPAIESYIEQILVYCPEAEELKDGSMDLYEIGYYDTAKGREMLYVDGVINMKAVRPYLTSLQGVYNKYLKTSPGDDAETRAYKVKARSSLNSLHSDLFGLVVTKYTAIGPNSIPAGTSQYEQMVQEIPLIAEGKTVFRFSTSNNPDAAIKELRKYSRIITRCCPEYDLTQLYADEAECKYEYQIKQQPSFRCSLEYTFNSDGTLSVRLPANSISFDESKYNLMSITPLPHFGAGNLKTDGYVFVPDGSGAIIEYEDFYGAETTRLSLTLEMYGKDYSYDKLIGAHSEQVTMPVYGIVGEQNSSATTKDITGKETTDVGCFAILEEGSSLAKLNVKFGGSVHNFASVYASFTPYPYDKFEMTSGGATEYNIFSKSRYTGSYVTKYVMLSDESVVANVDAELYPASYNGMATFYRNYLKDNGTLTALENLNEDLPLYIEALGSMEKIEKILTFPVTVSVPITTFDDVVTMYDELLDAKNILAAKAVEYENLAKNEDKDINLKASYEEKAAKYRELSDGIFEGSNVEAQNIKNVNFKLTGFANGGMYYTYPVKVDWEQACGDHGGVRELIEAAKERSAVKGQNFGLYPEFDFMYINYTALFDGISNKDNVSKMVDNRYASKQVYNEVTGEWETFFVMVITPDALDRLYGKFLGDYEDYDMTAISVSTLGSDLNSNFDRENSINRDEAQGYVEDLLAKISGKYDLMTSTGNIYSVKYADHILDIATDSSHYIYSSYTIPFTGLVLHGYVNYAGAAMNYSGTPAYDLLHSIENGASLYYILGYQNTELMKEDEDLNKYFGIKYSNWFDSLVESYAILNNAIGDLQGYEIVDHVTLNTERVLDEKEHLSDLTSLMDEFVESLDEQLEGVVNTAHNDMFGKDEYIGRGIKISVDVDSILALAVSKLNISFEDGTEKTELDAKIEELYTKFVSDVNSCVNAYYEEYNDEQNVDPYEVSFTADDFVYSTKYDYVTDSFALDEEYDTTDYTLSNHLVSMVTYKDAATGDVVRFILNYNIYSVTVSLNSEESYTIGKYGFVRIDD